MKKAFALVLAAVLCCSLFGCGDSKAKQYEEAIAALEGREYETAISLFSELGNYKDSSEQLHALETLEKTYQEAITKQQSGDYETAVELFRGLCDYRNSEEETERTEFAMAVLNSPVSQVFEGVVEGLDIQVTAALPATYDIDEGTITFTTCLDDGAIDFDTITYNGYDKWTNICINLRATSGIMEDYYLDTDGYDVKCEITLMDSSGNLLFATKSGEETYVFKSEDAFKAELEENEGSAEQEEAYQLALSHEKDMHYAYARVLFEEILDYRDAKEHYDRMTAILEPYNGTYNMTAFTGAKYKMTLQDGEGTLKWDLVDTVYSIELLGFDFNGAANEEIMVFTVNGDAPNSSTPIKKDRYYSKSMDVYSVRIDEKGNVMIMACEGNSYASYNASGTKK